MESGEIRSDGSFCGNCGVPATGNFCGNCGSPTAGPATEQSTKSSNTLVLILAATGVALLIGAGAFLLLSGDDDSRVAGLDTTTTDATTTTDGTTTTAEPDSTTTAGPTTVTAPPFDEGDESFTWYSYDGPVEAVEGTWISALRSIDASLPDSEIDTLVAEVRSYVPEAELLNSDQFDSIRNGFLVLFVGPFPDAGSTWDYCITLPIDCFGAPLSQDPADQSVRILTTNPKP